MTPDYRVFISWVGLAPICLFFFVSCNDVQSPAERYENTVTDCGDKIDNDGDGDIDCDDTECAQMAFCLNPDGLPKDTAAVNETDTSTVPANTDQRDTAAVNEDDTDDTAGDDTTDGHGEIGTDDSALQMDDNTPVDELSSDGQHAFCTVFYNDVLSKTAALQNAVNDVICNMVGVQTAAALAMQGSNISDIIASCENTKSDCENDAASQDSLPTTEDFCEESDVLFADCGATPVEIDICVTAIFDEQTEDFESAYGDIPACSELTAAYFELPQETDDIPEMETPAECAAVEQKCPAMLSK
ncbi:MAG: hypothetical protein JXX14_00715 [Deltaproteobacteria bacterium]|nr:hypothetical protein [Deltaproteobacteria bacterium]